MSRVIDAVRNRLGLKYERMAPPKFGTDGYKLGIQDGQVYIQCLTCNRKSFSMGDVHNLYCAHCHQFHEHDPRAKEAGAAD